MPWWSQNALKWHQNDPKQIFWNYVVIILGSFLNHNDVSCHKIIPISSHNRPESFPNHPQREPGGTPKGCRGTPLHQRTSTIITKKRIPNAPQQVWISVVHLIWFKNGNTLQKQPLAAAVSAKPTWIYIYTYYSCAYVSITYMCINIISCTTICISNATYDTCMWTPNNVFSNLGNLDIYAGLG